MKKLFAMTFCLLLCVSAQGLGQKKKVKIKEKRFEPVVKQNPADYSGKYVGFDEEHFLEVQVDTDGRWLIKSFEGNRQATLKDVRVDNARLTATKVYADGSTEKFSALFANRILNGESAFGMLVEGPIRVDESLTIERIFYQRR